MSAQRLPRLFPNTTDEQDRYEGGLNHWKVESKYGDIHLVFTETTGRLSSTTVVRLDDEDLDDLELALGRARSARDTYRLRRAS